MRLFLKHDVSETLSAFSSRGELIRRVRTTELFFVSFRWLRLALCIESLRERESV
jgi:hypothetical protein